MRAPSFLERGLDAAVNCHTILSWVRQRRLIKKQPHKVEIEP
jgi:hypothetical protein